MSAEQSPDDGDGGFSRRRILAVLGISGGVWGSLVAFGERLSEAESLRELVVEIVLTELVNGVLSLASYLFTEFLLAVDIIAESFWASLVAPFGELYSAATDPIIGALVSIRLSVESAVASTGVAAPFVALAGWVAVLLVVAVIIGVLWSLAETYLPTEAITQNAERALSLGLAPLRIAGRFLRAASRAVRGERTDGGTNDT